MDLFEPGHNPVNGERVRQGREARGLTQSALADAIGVDQTMIAHIERGSKQPTGELLRAISAELGFPPSFFQQTTGPDLPQGTLLFRAKAGIGKRMIAQAHAHAELAFEIIHKLSKRAKLLPVRIPYHSDPVEGARLVRKQVNAPPGPISSLLRVVETLGVLIVPLPPSDDCDAFAAMAGANRDMPVIGLSTGRSPDRLRMNVAHELGHIVLHRNAGGGTPILEREAYQFAAELLMPANDIEADLAADKLSLFRLAELKAKWNASMQAIARRARELQVINDRQYRYIMQQISARGWRLVEPDYGQHHPERPRALRKIIEVVFGDSAVVETVASELDLSPEFVSNLLQQYASAPTKAREATQHRSSSKVIVMGQKPRR
jgi:Zn-dependent peptidase ImmA (M78 family)/transcriptional regulator with XRE-family HTH domain